MGGRADIWGDGVRRSVGGVGGGWAANGVGDVGVEVLPRKRALRWKVTVLSSATRGRACDRKEPPPAPRACGSTSVTTAGNVAGWAGGAAVAEADAEGVGTATAAGERGSWSGRGGTWDACC